MPIKIRYQNDENQECSIRPTPLMSISTNILKDGAGEAFGVNYTITLNGVLIADQGTPYSRNQNGILYDFYGGVSFTDNQLIGPYKVFDNQTGASSKPEKQKISQNAASHSIFEKQKALRALFATDGQRIELSDWNDDEATIICYPRVVDINFEEGIYVDICRYSITLEADSLLNKNSEVNSEGSLIAVDDTLREGLTEKNLLSSLSGAFISSYSEEWSIEADDSLGESPALPKSYRITHSLNATGKTHYGPEETVDGNVVKRKAWEQAKKFVLNRLSNSASTDYPNIPGLIGSGTLNLIQSYGGYSQTRTEQISESDGTYSVTEVFLLASGTAYENYSASISSSISSPFVSVSIDGSIKGLSSISPSGFDGSIQPTDSGSAYYNALQKYYKITNSGQFGLTSDIYKRADNSVAVQLNSQPNSISLGTNEYTGEITYSLSFDNRPTNIISGVLSEDITVNDTYPGDVFSVVPVIGRKTGPVLQYIGGRTEYRRDISINLLMDYTKIPYGSTRDSLLLKKPSVVEPTATQIAELIAQLSPANEVGVRKYFISAPQENWNPKQGSYDLSISWTYELDQ